MRSRASLEYAQVQRAVDGAPDDRTAPLLDSVLKPLYPPTGPSFWPERRASP